MEYFWNLAFCCERTVPCWGMTFVSPWLLLWGVLALIPLAIHLWNRRHYDEVDFPAIEFLLAAASKNARRIQVEQWLLLFVRSLIFLLLACLLAEPSWNTAATEPQAIMHRHWILVMDASYSMGWTPDSGITLLEQAKQQAVAMVEAAPIGDPFSLIVLGSHAEAIVETPTLDRDEFMQTVQEVQLQFGKANLADANTLILRVLQQSQREAPDIKDRRVVLFSDLTEQTWSDAKEPSWQRSFQKISDQATVTVHSMAADVSSQSRHANFAVTDIRTSNGTVFQNSTANVVVTVRNFGSQAAKSTLTIELAGNPVESRAVELEPFATAEIEVPVSFSALGDQTVVASLAEDQLPWDNRRWLVVPVLGTQRILCLEGASNVSKNVVAALEPNAGAGPFRMTVLAMAEADSIALNDFNAVFVLNVASFSSAEIEDLRRYVQTGGAAIFVMGDQTEPSQWNRQWQVSRPEHSLIPVRQNDIVAGRDIRFEPNDYAHPLVKPFANFPNSSLREVPIWSYVSSQLLADSHVTLALSDGSIAVAERNFHAGRTMWVALDMTLPETTASESKSTEAWSAWPAFPCFPPMVHQLVRHATARQGEHRNVLLSDNLEGNMPTNPEADAQLMLKTPDGRQRNVDGARDGSHFQVAMRPAFVTSMIGSGQLLPGIYQVICGTQSVDFAVNLDTTESDLRPVDLSILPASMQMNPPDNLVDAALPSQPSGWPFRWLVILLIATLVGDSWLAHRMSRGA
ncbi:MAG: BatA domain-containing protein [Pirellulaceae bacterium]